VRWMADGKYAIRCGSYIISRNVTGAGDLFKAVKGRETIGIYTTAAEAKAACAADNKGATV
jgi:hypothetical protein